MIKMLEVFTELLTATLIVMIWSVLYRENIFYRIAEHIAIGSFFGYTLYMGLKTLYTKTFLPMIATGDLNLILVTMFGIMMWMRLIPSPKLVWISRISLSLLAGISIGIGIRGAISAQIIKQTIMGSWIVIGDIPTSINNIITTLFAFSTLVYFIYTREHKGVQGAIAKVGRIAIMVCFGAILGTFLMGNTAFSIGQIPKLVTGIGIYVSAVAVMLIIIDIFWQERKRKSS
jgi:hypothetical protein